MAHDNKGERLNFYILPQIHFGGWGVAALKNMVRILRKLYDFTHIIKVKGMWASK